MRNSRLESGMHEHNNENNMHRKMCVAVDALIMQIKMNEYGFGGNNRE